MRSGKDCVSTERSAATNILQDITACSSPLSCPLSAAGSSVCWAHRARERRHSYGYCWASTREYLQVRFVIGMAERTSGQRRPHGSAYWASSPLAIRWYRGKRYSENLLLPAQVNPHLARPDEACLSGILDSLGLPATALKLLPYELSLGMRQRVQFARLLAYRPRYSLLDEPFHGLDPANTKRLATALREYITTSQTCCILVTHDVLTAQQTADDFLFLNRRGEVRHLPAQPTETDLFSPFEEDME
jgi:ABC transporter